MKTLRIGDSGNEVEKLQAALNRAGFSIIEDGVFGDQTEAAVLEFQLSRKITVDGIVGDETWGELNKPTNNQLYNAFITCLDAIEDLPEFKQLEKILYG